MPIRPDLRHFYRGPAWRATRERILARAKDRCEQCGKPNGEMVETYTGTLGARGAPVMFWRAVAGGWRDMFGGRFSAARARGWKTRTIRVKVGIAHLDHDPSNNSDENLRALCDWCHLHYDKLHHRETRAARKDAARPIRWEGEIRV